MSTYMGTAPQTKPSNQPLKLAPQTKPSKTHTLNKFGDPPVPSLHKSYSPNSCWESSIRVNGPSFSSSTFMSAPKRPCSTVGTYFRHSAMKYS